MKKLILLIIPMLLLVSCSPAPQAGDGSCTLYYFENDKSDKLVGVSKDIDISAAEDAVREVFSCLKSTDDKKHVPVIPGDVGLSDVSLTDNTCRITLSERYLNINETSRIAINACLVKTLCSLPDIDRVTISCENVVNDFTESDFITETPRTYYDMYTVNLYFANEALDGLQADSEIIFLTPDTTLEHAVISRLLMAPSSDKLRIAIPAGTKLNNVYVSEGVCFVDLSSEFVTNVIHDEIHEGIALYSIVNTITELPMIDSVKFLIDGSDAYGYSYYNISKPLTNASDVFNEQ